MPPPPAAEAFPIDEVVRRLREAVRPFPDAALFALADEGYGSVFQQVVACILSVRTRDEATLVCARRLLGAAPDPAAMAALTPEAVDALIPESTFHEAKARQILAVSRTALDAYGGVLPCTPEALLALRGVGPKCAHLALGIACGQPRIAVDIHVHRVTNRWGYVAAPTPEGTLAQLERRLPEAYHVEINRLLVPFGKHICTGALPRCSSCPLRPMCAQIGVERCR